MDTACGAEGVDKDKAEAGDLLDRFCGHCCARESQVVMAAGYWQPGQMLVEAIQGSLPRNNAITVGKGLVELAVPEVKRWCSAVPCLVVSRRLAADHIQ